MLNSRSRLILVSIIFLGILIGCSSESKTLKLTPSRLDFESVYIGDARTIDVVLKNKYGKPIQITNISIAGSSDYTISAGNALPINMDKNAEHTLTVKFEPTSDATIEAIMSIVHDASTKTKDMPMTGIGVAVPRIEFSATSHDYGIRLFNTTTDYDFEIKNVGTADMTISSFTFTGAGATVYNIAAGGTIPTLITPGASHIITVQFAPTTAGTFSADLEIMHDAVNEVAPSKLTLDGEAVLTAPKIDLNQTSPWDFGSVATTIPAILDLEMSSIGSDPLTVTSITFATGTEWSVDHVEDSNGNTVNLPQTIQVGDMIVAKIKFTPTAFQNYNDTMTIMHDGLYNPAPTDIEVKGVGRAEVLKTFTYTGSAQQWTVPAGVSGIYVECYGAEGGQYSGHAIGGKGGMAKAKVPVTPGDTVQIYVGGKPTSLVGGFNGGGTGCLACTGAGGGGASDIRVGGSSLSDRKVVGAGGGGGGYNFPGYNPAVGGEGGGLTGQKGTDGYGPGGAPGGTQSAGGAAGGSGATAGVFGVGGDGYGRSCGGGGGGGGWYGGGGGYCDGGGGGSSYYDATGNTDKSTQQGVQSGHGQVIIRY